MGPATASTCLLALAVPNWAVNLMIVGFVFISVLMILVVLIQRPQGGGLSGAFGASSEGAGQTALGVKTGDVLTMVTIGVFVAFLGLAIALNYATRPDARRAAAQANQTDQQPATAAEPAPDAQPVGDEAGQATATDAETFTGDEAEEAITDAVGEAVDEATGNDDETPPADPPSNDPGDTP
jgi:preprotein translocase subunit SecG